MSHVLVSVLALLRMTLRVMEELDDWSTSMYTEKQIIRYLGVVVNCYKLTKKQRPFFQHFSSKYFALWLELLM